MIGYLPQVAPDQRTSLRPHTDFGTLKLLTNVIGGLQILEDGSAN
jgi:isopenicillin N synthase-like dioxygenase